MPLCAVTTYGSGMHKMAPRAKSPIQPREYVRGGFGGEMDRVNDLVTRHFLALPGWQTRQIDPQEIVFLSGFFAFVALASSPSAPLSASEAATGARATVARKLMTQGTTAEALTDRIRSFHARLNEYSALWVGIMNGANSFGAFSLRAFENVQAEDKVRHGYLEHLNAFPEFCERTIKTFHERAAVPWVP